MVSKGKVTAKDATTDQKGVSLLSTDQKTIAGEDSSSNVTPSSLKAKLGDQTIGKIAVGNGADQIIKWIEALSSDNSISITYNAENGTIDFKATGTGDVKSICVPETVFMDDGTQLAEPICIPPDANGSLNFTADPPIVLTPTENGLKISINQSAAGMQTINNIAPDASGNFKIQGKLPYIFDPIENGIELRDDGRIPYSYTTTSGTNPFVNNNFSIFCDDLAGEFFTVNNAIGLRYKNAGFHLGGLIQTTSQDQVRWGQDNEKAVTPLSLRGILGSLDENKIAVAKGSQQTIQYYDLVPENATITITRDDAAKQFKFTANSDIPIDPNVIVIQDIVTITRTAQDRTIYIVKNTNAKAVLKLPAQARLGFWFRVIGISGGYYVNINEVGNQKIKYKDKNDESSLLSDNEWRDAEIICYEENVRFKWLTF